MENFPSAYYFRGENSADGRLKASTRKCESPAPRAEPDQDHTLHRLPLRVSLVKNRSITQYVFGSHSVLQIYHGFPRSKLMLLHRHEAWR